MTKADLNRVVREAMSQFYAEDTEATDEGVAIARAVALAVLDEAEDAGWRDRGLLLWANDTRRELEKP